MREGEYGRRLEFKAGWRRGGRRRGCNRDVPFSPTLCVAGSVTQGANNLAGADVRGVRPAADGVLQIRTEGAILASSSVNCVVCGTIQRALSAGCVDVASARRRYRRSLSSSLPA
jgi:hypothetical protein